MKQNDAVKNILKLEQDTINEVSLFFDREYDFGRIVYTEWTAKDVLAHIVMWHESFANVVTDLVNGREPRLLKGQLGDINESGVKEFRKYTTGELKEKLLAAQKTVSKNIGNGNLAVIPYRKNSKRAYTPEEHLEVTRKHIQGHFRDILKKYPEAADGAKQ